MLFNNLNHIHQNDDKPIIYTEQSLNSTPKAIILSPGQNNERFEVTNMPLLGSETFDKCSDLKDIIKFQNGKEGDISISCKKINNIETLLLTAKEKKKKSKLGGWAIAGIVIACVAVVAIIVVVAILIIRRKRNGISRPADENKIILHNAHLQVE